MTTQGIVKISIILKTYQDWRDWFTSVKKVAKSHQILNFIDPDLAVPSIQPIRPYKPTYLDVQTDCQAYSNLTKANKETFKVLLSEYRLEREDFDRTNKALIDLNDLINSIVARPLRIYYEDCDTPYKILKALKLQLAVNDTILQQELKKIYSLLRKAS
jgi:hypothetical protein